MRTDTDKKPMPPTQKLIKVSDLQNDEKELLIRIKDELVKLAETIRTLPKLSEN